MASLGEGEISSGSWIIGEVRLKSFQPDPAVYPRLRVDIGVQLHVLSAESRFPESLVAPLQLRETSGELRLGETAEAVGPLYAGGSHVVVFSAPRTEAAVSLFCDLDHARLEAIERKRNGAAPTFYVQIWPRIVGPRGPIDADARILRARVPQEDWLRTYAALGGGHFDLLEIQFSAREAEQFKRAVARLQDARNHVSTGQYDDAVAKCRNAIDALRRELDVTEDGTLEALVRRHTDDDRTKEYVGLLSKLKQLTGFAHHEFGQPIKYSRDEAQFIVRVTESFVALIGRLSERAH